MVDFLSGLKAVLWGPPLRPIELFPRKKANLFETPGKMKALLPADFPALEKGFSENYKILENRFFPDLATKRSVTAYVCSKIGGEWKPQSGKEVFLRLAPGSCPKAKLSIDKGTTDADGCIEMTIEHPVETPPGPGLIFLQASFDEQFQVYSQMNFLICRNDDFLANLADVIDGKTLIVHQSSHPVESPGVISLQELLNQVVARKKSVTDFAFLEMKGKYDDNTKKAVKSFIEKFAGGFDYPKGKFNVKINELVKKYIELEYGSYADGQIVDRSILVGTKKWENADPVTEIDGLLDIYNGVVERFFSQMLARAVEYTSCDTFWLHRPKHRQYKQGEVRSVVMKEDADMHSAAASDSDPVKDKSNNTEKAKKGDSHKVIEDSNNTLPKWYKVRALDKAQGWVSDDQADEKPGNKVEITASTNLKSGNTAGSAVAKDSRGNAISMANGMLVKKIQKKAVGGKNWYKIQLDAIEGWLSNSDGKLGSGDKKFEVSRSATLKASGDAKAANVNSWSGSAMSVAKDDKLTYLKKKVEPKERWFKIENKNKVIGWIKDSTCTAISNDRAIAHNAGTFGMPGVAYSYGSKDTPTAFTASLQANSVKPETIDCWHLYENSHKPGKTSDDSDTANWTGIDCSGFTQNTACYALLTDNQRIVPEARMKRIGRVAGATGSDWPWTGCIPAKDFVGDYARQIPYDADNVHKQWLDQTDIITTAGHIVWVGDRNPDAISNKRDFQVYNAYGGDSRQNELPKVPTDKFIRKIIMMPFKWWGIRLGGDGVKVGRIYFWS